MHNRVLIAEDDKDIVELLRLYLESNGFSVLTVNDGVEALGVVNNGLCDILLADLMMPKMNGYDLIKKIRETNPLPIIIISAKNLDVDKVLGLNIGADAYITKPFNPLEVIAYVKATLRRFYELGTDGLSDRPKNLVVGELSLEMDKYILRKNGVVIPITSSELKIITKLMQNPGRVFTKTQLYECINGDYYENDDNTMMVHISNIRSKIEDDPSNPRYIKTVRGLGYKIEDEQKI